VFRETPYMRYISSDQTNWQIGPFRSRVQLPIWAMRWDSDRRRSFSRSASSASLRPVLSRAIFDAPITTPSLSLIGEIVTETSIFMQSLDRIHQGASQAAQTRPWATEYRPARTFESATDSST
jgi:hypothetical protein